MYVSNITDEGYKDVENKCFDDEHIEKVVAAIKTNFDVFFDKFIASENNIVITNDEFYRLQEKFGISAVKKDDIKNKSVSFKRIIVKAIDEFEKNREKYLSILDLDCLEEYEDNPLSFKDRVLKNECPVIHSTLMNKTAKELDKYRLNFRQSNPQELLQVVTNLTSFGKEYIDNNSDHKIYDEIDNVDELGLLELDEDKYTVYSVIGGGIKSHLLYKLHPGLFPNRSRDAIWAMWFLTGKETFGCIMDSEFLMIDTVKYITQQNYFYPYGLFGYYAFEIYKLLKEKAELAKVYIDPEYRYVIVNEFLEFIAKIHDDEIKFLKSQIRDGGLGYA